MKLSKGREICYDTLKMHDYLKPNNNISFENKFNILSIRIRDLIVKCNFSNYFSDTKCVMQCSQNDSQFHLFEPCEDLKRNDTHMNSTARYEDIFGINVSLQMSVMQIIMERYHTRNDYLSPC